MTKQQSQELLDFVKSGYPVVISSNCLPVTGKQTAQRLTPLPIITALSSRRWNTIMFLKAPSLAVGKRYPVFLGACEAGDKF